MKLRKRLEALEKCFLRRMLSNPWTARMTYERVLELVGVKKELMRVVRTRQFSIFGHIMRRSSLEKDVFLGRIKERRARSRP